MTNEIQNTENSHSFIIKSGELFSNESSNGLGYTMFEYMKRNSTRIAQYDMSSNTEETFENLLKKSVNTALSLKAKKLPQEPIISIFSTNHANTCVPILASLFLGYKVNAYDCQLRDSDLVSLLQQIPPSIMFIDEQFVDKMESAIKLSDVTFELVVFEKSDKYTVFDDMCRDNEESAKFVPIRIETGKETAVIMFSSGTTGLPKGICLSHNTLVEQAHCLVSMLNLKENSVFLHFSAYNWITAYVLLFATMVSGASRVITTVSAAWEAIYKYKVTHIYAPPHLGSHLLSQEKPNPRNNKSVKCFITAGSKLSNKIAEELKIAFPEALLSQSYGQTEAGGWITIFQWHKEEEADLARRNPDSVGKLLPGYSCKVVDIDTEMLLGPNQTGEIRLKSESFYMNGYYQRDSSDNFDSSGWLKTGDLGYYDENYCFYLVGRCKEMIKYREFHIRPQILENILESHPSVDRAVVIGLTHPIDGEHARAIVVLKRGKENTPPEYLRSFVDDQVEDRMKLRGGVQIVDGIPITSTGKLRRMELKKLIENTLG